MPIAKDRYTSQATAANPYPESTNKALKKRLGPGRIIDWMKVSTFGEAPMTWFRDFNIPLWEVFGGNLLLVATLGFYIAWWTAAFRPNADGQTTGAGFFLTIALFAGVAAVAILVLGIEALSQVGQGFPVMVILLGAAAVYILLLAVTKVVFQRAVTSELLLIVVWAALECSVLAVLRSSGRFSLGQALTVGALVALATGIGLVCYVLHYRLDETARFWNGLIPLIVDAGVVTVFLAVLALS